MKIKFLTPVWHGADLYSHGNAADIDDEEANALIHMGAAEAVMDDEDTAAEVQADAEDTDAAEISADADGAKD